MARAPKIINTPESQDNVEATRNDKNLPAFGTPPPP